MKTKIKFGQLRTFCLLASAYNVTIKICLIIILPRVLCDCETCRLNLREEDRLEGNIWTECI
jgi:hypothetical protein